LTIKNRGSQVHRDHTKYHRSSMSIPEYADREKYPYDYDVTDQVTGRETYARTLDYIGLTDFERDVFKFMHDKDINSLTVDSGVRRELKFTISKV